MTRIREIGENVFLQLILVYSLLVAFIAFGLFWRYSLQFHIFAAILGVIGISIIIWRSGDEYQINKIFHYCIFIFALLLILALRIIPYIGNDIYLGYDPGLYKYAIERGLEKKDLWVLTGVEPAFLYFMNFIKIFLSVDFILKWLFIGFNVGLGLSIYFFVREYWNKNAALISLLLFAVSVVQFKTFWYMYYKNIIGLSMMLFALYFLHRYEKNKIKGDLIAFIVIAGVLGGIHKPTFYIFGLSYFFYSFMMPYGFNEKRKYDWNSLKINVISGVLILLIAFSFYIGDFFVSIITVLPWVAHGFISPGESPGTFISFFQYQFAVLPYLPFAVLGLIYLWKKDKGSMLFIWAVVNLIIVYFQFFFFNRFIIHLDTALLILSGISINALIERKRKFGVVVLCILLLAGGILIVKESLSSRPLISEDGLRLIEKIGDVTEENAKIVVLSSEYSPWVLAYSNRETIAPGLFDANVWSEEEWNEFWNTDDKDRTVGLVGRYSGEIYLFAGTKRFKNECFELFLEEGGNSLYKYKCR